MVFFKVKIILTGCSLLCRGLEILTKHITPNFKGDDKAVNSVKKVVDTAQKIINTIEGNK